MIVRNHIWWCVTDFALLIIFLTLHGDTSSQCPQHDTAGQPLCDPQEAILFLSALGFHAVRMFAPPGLHTWVVYLCQHSAGGEMPVFNRLVIMPGPLFVRKPSNCWLERLTGSYLRGGYYTAVIMCLRIRKRVCKCVRDTERKRTWLSLIERDIKKENGQICSKVSGNSEGPFLSRVNITSS